MRITILNGEPDPATPFQQYVLDVARQLAASGHTVTTLDLRELDLKGCSGCFGCWVKTPGECVKRDGSAQLCRAVIRADLAVLASPVTMGYTSTLLKRATDQMIPLIHPFFVIEGGARCIIARAMPATRGSGCCSARRAAQMPKTLRSPRRCGSGRRAI